VVKLFQPYHVDFDVTEKKEMTLALITAKVEMAAGMCVIILGNADYVRNADFAIGKPEFGKNQNQKVASSLGKTPSQPNIGSSATYERPKVVQPALTPQASTQASTHKLTPELEDALKQVRDDKSSSHWVAAGFQDNNLKNQLVLLEKGESESVEEIKQLFAKDKFVFALQRVTDVIDGHKTVKFVFINWIGPNVSLMNKAKISTLKGTRV
jgi:drebrin-like protein